MPKVNLKKRIRHSPDDMLALVANVEDYPVFINLISAVRILDRKKTSKTSETFTADVGIQYKFISEQFRSIVSVDRVARTLSIERAGHGGAVKELQNNWQFFELEDGSTLLDFSVNVRMKAAPLEFLIKRKFDKATYHIINAFEARAHQIFKLVGEKDYDYKEELRTLSADGFV